ncbi:Cleavage/polyadenylation specificity factor A subunit [Botryosphaeria dothidea]|uniref:Cleavage/polyadenylation specificity factor A subunit n=1 Tax=Botryosphaeria dothidea TaxID=55169 RepID=A0A8H4IIR2_9PEZI|nr:Cleavage/polyadenylation specificity factor A subunit [Botryosphaeria dothidea]
MALQTGVFENGQWVTRRVSIQDILQQNSQRESHVQQTPFRPPMEQPVVGLLSRSVLQSPVVNWIIPARVRNREKNDVVFIGEDFIQLKEILPNAHLEHVSTKADFGSRIRAARVFGEPRKFIHPPMTEKAQIPMEMDWNEAVPPQLLVLTLESQELLFLFARPQKDGTVEWKESCIPLSPDASLLEQPGKHLAVDPRSRALAVGASESSIFIYAAKPMPDLRNNFDHDTHNWTPLKSERPVAIPGTILKMEFLYPEPDDERHVILLVIYSRDGKTRMSCYEWDHRQGLSHIRPVVEGFPLHHNQRNPQLLIPLQHGPSFILAGHVEIYLHQEIMTGNPKRSSVSLSKEEGPRYPGNSRRFPTWTSWARTGRNWIWNNKQEENFYLVREDGVVHYMQVNSRSGALTSKAGHFMCNVASAFASLDVGYYLDTPDVLVTAGDMSPGEIVKIGQWRDEIQFNDRKGSQRTRAQIMEPDFINAIQNWSPTLDLILADGSFSSNPISGGRRRILATSGRTPHGAVTEIRAGLNAKLGLTFEEDDLAGVTGFWSFPDSSENGVYFLLSFPSSSILLHIAGDASGVDTEFDEENSGVDFDNETLTSDTLQHGLAVQITPRALIVLDVFTPDSALPRKGSWPLPSEETIQAASVCPGSSSVYAGIRGQNGFSVQSMRIEPRGDEVKFTSTATVALSADPTCVQILEYDTIGVLLVATTDGLIRLYKIQENGGIGHLLEQHQIWQDDSTQETLNACQSAVLLHNSPSNAAEADIAIVCGLRSGDLYVIELHARTIMQKFDEEDSTSPRQPAKSTAIIANRRITLGHTPTSVMRDSEGDGSLAFATCGAEFYRLDYSNGRAIGLDVTNIWFTDRNRPNLQQSPVSAVCRIPRESYLIRDLGGALVCISGISFFVAQLEDERHMVPRSIPVRGTPNRVIYSEELKAIFVACLESHTFEPVTRDSHERRYAQSYVRMYEDGPVSTSTEPVAEYKLPPTARVNALSTWVLENSNGKQYPQIVVGTVEGNGRKGGVLCIRETKKEGKSKLEIAKEISYKQQVTAVASYGPSNFLVVCYGRKLVVYQYFGETKRIQQVGEHDLPSPGLYITTEAPFIYVSTACDSLVILKADHDRSENSMAFELLFSDRQARDTSFHLPLNVPQVSKKQTTEASGDALDELISDGVDGTHNHGFFPSSKTPETPSTNLVLVADKAGSLTLLHLPRKRTHQTAAPTLLEASLPRSVMRLRRGLVRPTLQYHQNNAQGPSTAAGVLVNDIIGAASDGTLFGFSLVDERAWRLLRFLQNLCNVLDREKRAERPGGMLVPLVNLGMSHRLIAGPVRLLDDEEAELAAAENMDVDSEYGGGEMELDNRSPTPAGSSTSSSSFASAYPQASVHQRAGQNGTALHAQGSRLHTQDRSAEALLRALDPDKDTAGLKRRTAYHVDGDALTRFLGREGGRLLSAMLEIVCQGGPNGAGQDIRRRFVEFAEDALGARGAGEMEVDSAAMDGGRVADEDMVEVVRRVVGWLRGVLAPVL